MKFMSYLLLGNLHMNIMCLYYAFVLVELGFTVFTWLQFVYVEPYRLVPTGFILKLLL